MECYCVPLRKSLIHACLFRKEDGGQQQKKGKGQHKLWGKERREMRSEYKKERRGSYPSQAQVYPNL